MFDFQKLDVYQKAKVFHLECRQLILDKKPDSFIRDQLLRASFSISLNIAEGSAKFSKPDRKNYFTTARGSVFECVAVFDLLHDLNTISKVELDSLMLKADELSRMLYTMIKNLAS